MHLLVGLGNPGDKYRNNRHNIGFMAVQAIGERHGFAPFRQRFKSYLSEGRIGTERVALLLPQTFMNLSGEAVQEAAHFYKLHPASVLVFHDELDLLPGRVRVKQGGGHGGHNGLRSIDSVFANDTRRVRLGIGHPGDKARVHGHVLGDFSRGEWPWVEALCKAAADEAALLVAGDAAGFMNRVTLAVKDLVPPDPRALAKAQAKADAKAKKDAQEAPSSPESSSSPISSS